MPTGSGLAGPSLLFPSPNSPSHRQLERHALIRTGRMLESIQQSGGHWALRLDSSHVTPLESWRWARCGTEAGTDGESRRVQRNQDLKIRALQPSGSETEKHHRRADKRLPAASPRYAVCAELQIGDGPSTAAIRQSFAHPGRPCASELRIHPWLRGHRQSAAKSVLHAGRP